MMNKGKDNLEQIEDNLLSKKLKIVRELLLDESLTPQDEAALIELLRKYMLQQILEFEEVGNEIYPRKLSDIFKFRQLLTNESDRGCVLVGASLIDMDLKNMISAHFVDAYQKDQKEFLEGQGPLATFSSRIKLSCFLGLISEDTYRDCNIIRKIRNDFAHTYEEISFQTPQIKSRCLSLSGRRIANPEEFDPVLRLHESNPRYNFMTTVISILSEIHSTWRKAERPNLKTKETSDLVMEQISEDLGLKKTNLQDD